MTPSSNQQSFYVTHKGVICPGHPVPGRPLNSRPRLITALREALDEDDTLDRLRRVAIERMEAGDPAFWKMLLERIWPARVELSAETNHVVEFRWAGPEASPPRRRSP